MYILNFLVNIFVDLNKSNDDDQHINFQSYYDRNIYIIKPKEHLLEKLEPYFNQSELEAISEPSIMMTAVLPFDLYLDSWSPDILKKCKEAFIRDQQEQGIFFDLEDKKLSNFLGPTSNPERCFDAWWAAEQVRNWEEIPTDWRK
ncbi:MAG: hypothetical protein ACRBBN_21630 [Methyloligellaceae bacterium]